MYLPMHDAEYLNRLASRVGSFLENTFAAMHFEGPALDPAYLGRLSLMPVCTHRSHTDYFILGSFLHRIGVHNIRYAAGDNLTGLPLIGPRFLSWGAFPVSRTRAMNRTYVRTLCEQVVAMLNDGGNVIVFPEGGRSYKGNMMEIKYGLIGASIVAQWRNPEREHAFFPLTISYERLPEVRYFETLEKGRAIRKANGYLLNRIRGNMLYFGADLMACTEFILANKSRKKHGEVFIDYREPVRVSDIVDLKECYSAKARDDFSAFRRAMQVAGNHLFEEFMRLYRLLPIHICAAATGGDRSCPRAAVIDRAGTIVARARDQKRNTKSLDTLTEEQIVDKGTEQLAALRAVTSRRNTIVVRRPSIVSYHAASIAPE
ncbi:MAG: hypothetical protein GF418_03420 [Chitinivibrionales bacterium]|nr:hypothetical protein [Chitinivibrionales bacterium]MBD3394653.1 hypothetical protein [Chitinivibrionales bacterium]